MEASSWSPACRGVRVSGAGTGQPAGPEPCVHEREVGWAQELSMGAEGRALILGAETGWARGGEFVRRGGAVRVRAWTGEGLSACDGRRRSLCEE